MALDPQHLTSAQQTLATTISDEYERVLSTFFEKVDRTNSQLAEEVPDDDVTVLIERFAGAEVADGWEEYIAER